MLTFGVMVLLVLANWWSFRAIARRRSQQRHAPLTSTAGGRAGLPVTAAPIVTEIAKSADQPLARAFPVQGLLPGRDGAGILEGILGHVAGVTRAYVSPVTALAYVDYLPAQVTEEQLVRAIRGGGYLVSDEAPPFDWRHGHGG